MGAARRVRRGLTVPSPFFTGLAAAVLGLPGLTPPDPRRLFLKISAASSPGRGQRPQQVNSRAGLCGTVYLMVVVPA